MSIGEYKAVLDICTTKVVALIASQNNTSGNLDILGIDHNALTKTFIDR